MSIECDKYYERFSPLDISEIEEQKWKKKNRLFLKFLSTIPLEHYRNTLSHIKTIEFNLSGKYKSFHLSLIYHLYWKQKYISIKNTAIPKRLKVLKKFQSYFDSVDQHKMPLYELINDFPRDECRTEDKFIKWYISKEWSNAKPEEYIKISTNYVDVDCNSYLSFEDFWKLYLSRIDIDNFIDQHDKYVDIVAIKKEFEKEKAYYKKYQTNALLGTDSLDDFIKIFIIVGLKARIYRTWVSILTQLNFAYTWNAYIDNFKIDSDVFLDTKGIDAFGSNYGELIGFQIKKQSNRPESLRLDNENKYLKTLEIQYDLKYESKEFYKDKLRRLDNGFIVFQKEYVNFIINSFDQNN
ncbi:MAG: TaqI family restriction endonuclease [candidate division WOR-3 bacterium]|nr:TaqI family restriction endonuclease [candidate division WOR-3 bacterium]